MGLRWILTAGLCDRSQRWDAGHDARRLSNAACPWTLLLPCPRFSMHGRIRGQTGGRWHTCLSHLLWRVRPRNRTAIAIDMFGDAWIAGTTVSPNFPTTSHALQNQFHGEIDLGPLQFGDAFVAELDPAGSTPLYSTYLGGRRRRLWQCNRGGRQRSHLRHRLYAIV
jgi:hypothetical protein